MINKLSKREIQTQKEREERARKIRYKLQKTSLREKEAEDELRNLRKAEAASELWGKDF